MRAIKDRPPANRFYIAQRPLTIAPSVISFSSLSSLPNTPTSTIFSFDLDMASSTHCHQVSCPQVHCPQVQATDLWITYHQASRAQKQVTAQLVDVSDAVHLFDLEDVLDHVFEQGFVDPKWRSVTWWEDNTLARLKTSSTVQDLLGRGAGSTPETALRLIIGELFRFFPIKNNELMQLYNAADTPAAIWVHYEYVQCGHPHTATQRIRLDVPHFKCERLADLTNHIFTKGYLPCKARCRVSWKRTCGKHVEENSKVEDVLSWGEGVCEEKPLRLVIGESL